MPGRKYKTMRVIWLRVFLFSGAKTYLTTAINNLQWIADFIHFKSFYLPYGLRWLNLELWRQVPALHLERFLLLSDSR